jgi:non-heme chloroperoxidase
VRSINEECLDRIVAVAFCVGTTQHLIGLTDGRRPKVRHGAEWNQPSSPAKLARPRPDDYLAGSCGALAPGRCSRYIAQWSDEQGGIVMSYLEVKDGTRLFYTDTGGTDTPMVFVSSAWLSSRMWEYQVPYMLAGGLRCVTYDRRGHGRSDWPFSGYDYDTVADDLAALLTHLDLRNVTLVAHSAGGGDAVRYLTRHGAGRIARLALVSALAPFPMQTTDNPNAVPRTLMEADLAARTADRPKWFADNANGFFGIGLPGISISEQFVEFMIQQCLDCSAIATAAYFLSGFTTDLRAEMQAIDIPTLIIHGDRDQQAPFDICGRLSAQLVPRARLIVYEHAAHGLFITHADRLNADLGAFEKTPADSRA